MKGVHPATRLPEVLRQSQDQILAQWLEQQVAGGRPSGDDAKDLSSAFLTRLVAAAATSGSDPSNMSGPAWDEVRALLSDFSRSGCP